MHGQEPRPYEETELLYGRKLLEARHPVLRAYLLREERIRKEILDALAQAGTEAAAGRVREIGEELRRVREALARLERRGVKTDALQRDHGDTGRGHTPAAMPWTGTTSDFLWGGMTGR